MNIRKFWRSSISGRFVRKREAEASPATTQEETAREPSATAWQRFVDSKEYLTATYYASTPETRSLGLRMAFEAGRRDTTKPEEILTCAD